MFVDNLGIFHLLGYLSEINNGIIIVYQRFWWNTGNVAAKKTVSGTWYFPITYQYSPICLLSCSNSAAFTSVCAGSTVSTCTFVYGNKNTENSASITYVNHLIIGF